MNKLGNCLHFMRLKHKASLNIINHLYSSQKQILNYLPAVSYLPSSFLTVTRYLSNDTQTDLKNVTINSDVLLLSIKKASSTNDVLEMLRIHNNVMTPLQHMEALNTIFILQKKQCTKLSNEELIRSPEFTVLCRKILNQSRHLDLNNVLTNIKCLSYLGVPVNSNIMQMLLQIMSKMVNELSLQQIMFLQFLLKDLSSCPLVDALKLALPIVFEAQIQYKMIDNLYWQVEFLNYITKHKLSQGTFDFVMSKINQNFHEINPSLAKNLVCTLYQYGYSTEQYISIINKCLNILMSQPKCHLTISDTEAILSKMINKYLLVSEIFYNELFINHTIDQILKKQTSFEALSFIVKKINKVGFVHLKLLDHLTNLLISEPESLNNCKFGTLFSYIGSCSIANYIPPGFHVLKPFILKRLIMQKDILELPWLKLTLNLAVLDCWSEELLEKIFSRSFLQAFLKRDDNQQDYNTLLQLYQAVLTLYPGGYQGLLPPNDILEKAIKVFHPKLEEYPLKTALEHGLGGKDYVITPIRSKLGHFIDHVVVMRPGGYSVAIKKEIKDNTSDILLEDVLNIGGDNMVLCVLLNRPTNFVSNIERLKGPNALRMKTIEALGVTVVPVSEIYWNSLIGYEKIPYIMQELKSKSNLTENHLTS
ncbi:uncharacterized protein LOC126844902 isoform X2 [Adelges cooleyi]|nr:uncharacterized protein LOC126844902 isoform X2 [Adelges cooleyi]